MRVFFTKTILFYFGIKALCALKICALQPYYLMSKYKNSQLNKLRIFSVLIILSLIYCFSFPPTSYAQDDILKLIEKKQAEIKDKEVLLKQEEKRLQALKKDIDDRIEKYTKILAQLEDVLKKIEQAREQNFEHIVKTYETMPPEEAAQRLSILDEELLVKIILKMKPKKAAAIMALMDTKKAASVTQSISSIEKKFPTK